MNRHLRHYAKKRDLQVLQLSFARSLFNSALRVAAQGSNDRSSTPPPLLDLLCAAPRLFKLLGLELVDARVTTDCMSLDSTQPFPGNNLAEFCYRFLLLTPMTYPVTSGAPAARALQAAPLGGGLRQLPHLRGKGVAPLGFLQA